MSCIIKTVYKSHPFNHSVLASCSIRSVDVLLIVGLEILNPLNRQAMQAPLDLLLVKNVLLFLILVGLFSLFCTFGIVVSHRLLKNDILEVLICIYCILEVLFCLFCILSPIRHSLSLLLLLVIAEVNQLLFQTRARLRLQELRYELFTVHVILSLEVETR